MTNILISQKYDSSKNPMKQNPYSQLPNNIKKAMKMSDKNLEDKGKPNWMTRSMDETHK